MLTGTAFFQESAIVGATYSPLLGNLRLGSTGAAYSATGSTWTAATLPITRDWYGMAYSSTLNLFVAVSEAANGTAIYSSNMTSFTQSQAIPYSRSITWAPELGLFINGAGGSLSSSPSVIRTSTDGIIFTTQSTPSTVTNFIETIVWSGSLAVAVTQNSKVMTSPDAITWTERTAATGEWHGGAYSPQLGLYVIGGINGYVGTSSNGTSWTVGAVTGNWRKFAWSPTLNLFVGTRFGSTIAYSSNGTSWTASSSPSSQWWDVLWNPDQAVFHATRFGTTTPNYYSSDGINWTAQAGTLTSGTWIALAYRPRTGY